MPSSSSKTLAITIVMMCTVSLASSGAAQDTSTDTMSLTDASSEPAASSAPASEETQHCARGYDASSPHVDISAGGGYGAYFVTWVQANDVLTLTPPNDRPADGLYQGPTFHGEVELGIGMVTLSVAYTHLFSHHDSGASREWGFLTGGVGLQCACMGSVYVWSFGLDAGWEVINHSVVVGAQHRSQFFVWRGLFIGVDLGVSLLVGLTSQGASGGGFDGSLVLGYSLG
jgi:hypothetical protein